MVHGWNCDCRFPTEGRRRDAVQRGKLKCLADYSRMKLRNVDWVLKINEDNEFYLHLKDISGRLPLYPSIDPRPVEAEQFDFLKIPPEIQLSVLRHVSSSDLGSCRLTCRLLDKLIKRNWNNLKPRNIGVVEFTPGGDFGCLKGFIRFYYKRKLESLNNVVIVVLISFLGEFTIPRIQSFTQILNQSRISIKKIVICNTPCSCELEHLIALIEGAHAECLIIDVCGRIELGKKLAKDPVIQRLQGVLIYSNGDEASYFTAKPFIDYESFNLEDMRVLMEAWHSGFIIPLHLHMPLNDDWPPNTRSVLKEKALRKWSHLHGNVLRTDGGQELRVEVGNGRVTFAYVERKRKRHPHV